MHTYSSATYTYFDLSHTLSQDVTNAWMLHTFSLLHKHTHADVIHNFSNVTHTHSNIPGLGHGRNAGSVQLHVVLTVIWLPEPKDTQSSLVKK